MDKMFQATTVIAVLLLCLGILYSPCQAHHKFLSNPINSIGIIAPFVLVSFGTFFLQVLQMCGWCLWGGLVALELPQGEEAGRAWLWSIISHLSPRTLGKLHRIFLVHFSGHPQVIRVSPDLQSCLQVGYHCFWVFRKPTIKRVSLQLCYSIWGKVVRKGSSQNLEMS